MTYHYLRIVSAFLALALLYAMLFVIWVMTP